MVKSNLDCVIGKLATTTIYRKVEPKIKLMEGFNLHRGNKSNFNEEPDIPVKISTTAHDSIFAKSFTSITTNRKKHDISHKKQEDIQLSTKL